MFGLSQLYQLRGRVGRGRQRAYAYLTSDPNRLLTMRVAALRSCKRLIRSALDLPWRL